MVLAGGTETMSRAPLIFNKHMTNWFATMMRAKTPMQKIKQFTKLRPAHLSPIISLLRGLRDPIVGLSMGQTTENIAKRFNISREEMDAFSAESHKRVARAEDEKRFAGVMTPIFDKNGKIYESDDGLRRDSTVETLKKPKPFFDKKFGLVTAANSSQVTDGAAFAILADEESVKEHNLPTLAKIVDVEWAGVEPEVMGLGPAHAVPPLLARNNLKFEDIEYWELNEAFAGQVLGCVKAWECEEYCKNELGLDGAFGSMDMEKLNTDGGAVALGHPVGASGARIVLQLINTMKREGAKLGVATICIGGGQAGAMLIEMTNTASTGE
jgi:acetyl-CoA C-acetyltransferase